MNWYLIDLPDFKACIQAPTKIHAVEFSNNFTIYEDIVAVHIKGKIIAPPIPIKQARISNRGVSFANHFGTTNNDEQIPIKRKIKPIQIEEI